ncbi:MAG: trehalose-phosphatase [Candidatus Promineifilaceae bacterium]
MISCEKRSIVQRLADAPYLWLFLDYDGTLADFAATPEEVIPDGELIALIAELEAHPDIRVSIISGRRLAHIQELVPVEGILKAGSYGLELQTPDGSTLNRIEYEVVRPVVARIKERWEDLLAGRGGFFLEDKGWTAAIHAKDADPEEAMAVLKQAEHEATELLLESEPVRLKLQGGHLFLECAPREVDKKRTVAYMLDSFPWNAGALPVYLGDDDKDEVAFEAVQAAGGLVVAVGERLKESTADCWLASPKEVRNWLRNLLEARAV